MIRRLCRRAISEVNMDPRLYMKAILTYMKSNSPMQDLSEHIGECFSEIVGGIYVEAVPGLFSPNRGGTTSL